MTHLIKHEISCDFMGCETVERYEHYDFATCALDHMHWPQNWIFVSRNKLHTDKYCPRHSMVVGEDRPNETRRWINGPVPEDGKITISDEPEKVGRFDRRGVIPDV